MDLGKIKLGLKLIIPKNESKGVKLTLNKTEKKKNKKFC